MDTVPVDICTSGKEEKDGTHTITMVISGIPSPVWAQIISFWLHQIVEHNAPMLGEYKHHDHMEH